MAFIDEIKIEASAGRGGDGVVRWRQEKFVPKGGPSGGDGGRGGDFFAVAVRDAHILSKYKAKKKFNAGRGEDGGNKNLHGKNGEDFILELPVGSVVTNLITEERWELLEDGQKVLLLKGGYGGFGNEHFKSSTNTTPIKWRPGQDGERGNFQIELELFADMGLIGLPNAGKSSLLNSLTNSKALVGDYPFTTLDPNLGDFFGYIIADIPGLIEGANTGKGLGVKFLRHIKRTKMLAHLVSFESEQNLSDFNGPENLTKEGTRPVRSKTSKKSVSSNGMMKAYKEIRKELEKYDKNLKLEDGLSEKEEIIVLTKSDVATDPKIIAKKVAEFSAIGGSASGGKKKQVFTLSLYDDKSVKDFSKELTKILKKSK